MSASALVLQLIRGHYARDEAAVAGAAMALARGANSAQIRSTIQRIVQAGYSRVAPGVPQVLAPRPAPIAGSNLVQALDTVSFADLALQPALQAALDEIAVELEYRSELAARKLRARNRLLFWGPPGNGKTSAAAALANALGVQAYGVSLPRMISKWLGETGQNLGAMFDALSADTLIVFDEIDAIGSRRGDVDTGAGKEANSVVNTMLTLLDRNRSGIIVATTNRPDIVDPALLRRFDELFEFPAPTPEEMHALAVRLCADHGVPAVDVGACRNFDDVAKHVERTARRVVMAEILAADAAEGADDGEEEERQRDDTNPGEDRELHS